MVPRWTADLLGLTAWTIAAAWVALRSGWAGAPRIVAVLPLLILFPGYAIVAVLYPRGCRDPDDRRLGLAERLGLSVALSLVVVPAVAFAQNFAIGIYARPLVLTVGAVTAGFAMLALGRRAMVSADERFGLADLQRRDGGGGLPGGMYSIVLVVSLMLVAASGMYAAVQDPPREQFTELYLLAEDDSGELSTEAVDSALADGRPMTVAVRNHEGQDVEYTVVIVAQTVDDESVSDERRLRALDIELGAGETAHWRYDPPDEPGDRIVVRLYRGSTDGTPYRSTQVWVP